MKPVCSAVTTYTPTGSSGTTKSPTSVLVVSRVRPVCSLVTTTLTFGITAPLESLTEPVIWPVAVCAPDGVAMPSSAAITEASRDSLVIVVLPPLQDWFEVVRTCPKNYAPVTALSKQSGAWGVFRYAKLVRLKGNGQKRLRNGSATSAIR